MRGLEGIPPVADLAGERGRGQASFAVTVATVRRLAEAGLLQGLLCTPNNLAEAGEYGELCRFAVDCGAGYVLMNPLSSMGRGVKAKTRLAASTAAMNQIREETQPYASQLDLAHIRFPNENGLPLAGCEAGRIIYVFTPGEVTICPYLVFAARTPQARHDPAEFIVGNIFTDPDIAARLDRYQFHQRYQVGGNPTCGSCSLSQGCGKGCPAAVIAAGGQIGEVDTEQCPVTAPHTARLLPVTPA
jgi:radical SAM protein with 4Fe4S-binding SPASM domain